jgi:hypothetical protein
MALITALLQVGIGIGSVSAGYYLFGYLQDVWSNRGAS